MTPFFRNHFKIYKEDTSYANNFRHALSSDEYLSTGGYIPQVFALVFIIIIQYLGKLRTSTRSGH